MNVYFGIIATLCVLCTVVKSQTNASCADMYDSSSTSDCYIPTGWIRDNWCDCPDCEDEFDWTCDTCEEGCYDECDEYGWCGSKDETINYDTGCNFGVSGSLLIPENYCLNFESSSATFSCDDDNMGIITNYNDGACGDDGGSISNTSSLNYYSCSSDTSDCDESMFNCFC